MKYLLLNIIIEIKKMEKKGKKSFLGITELIRK